MTPYDTTTNGHYIMTESDFGDPYLEQRKDGVTLATGLCRRGDTVTMPLEVPLCSGCDAEIINAVCHDCGCIFLDLIEMEKAA